jgi:putative ATP-dependent endonuclease of the OLD family
VELVSFSVQNYRSIAKANRIEVGRSTVLVGPNNEGKSNVLRALVTAMEVLKTGDRYNFAVTPGIRVRFPSRLSRRGQYDWDEDFPINLQGTSPNGVSTFLLEFELDEDEIEAFRTEVRSNLNGTLPIQLELGRDSITFTVPKKGPGARALSAKASAIAKFVAERVEFEYIPAIRTAESSARIVDSLVQRELESLETLPEYQAALAKIKELQQPVLDSLSKSVHSTMIGFLPAIRGVQFEIEERERALALRRSSTIIVDDGTPTDLARKGDGVQSLAALALMRHASEIVGKGKSFVIAIEEPESHLHPSAIRALRNVIDELTRKYQVVITTHSPLFVDRVNIRSNILVNDNRAVPARSIDQIRSILGVRASDNLKHAELVLVVEGDDDKVAISALMRDYSPKLATAIDSGKLAFETLAGGTNLSYVISLLLNALMCGFHCFLDDDECGRDSYEKAKLDGLLDVADASFSTVLGMTHSEIEDLYDLAFYKDLVRNQFNVSLDGNPRFRTNKKKWSDRVREVFRSSGRAWNPSVEMELKAKVAALVASNPKSALHLQKRSVIDSLAETLLTKLGASTSD